MARSSQKRNFGANWHRFYRSDALPVVQPTVSWELSPSRKGHPRNSYFLDLIQLTCEWWNGIFYTGCPMPSVTEKYNSSSDWSAYLYFWKYRNISKRAHYSGRIATLNRCSLFLQMSWCNMICLLVTTTSPAKLAEPSRDAVWDVDLGGPSNHLLDGHPDPLKGRSTFEGDDTRISPRALYQHSNGWPLKQSVSH